MKDSCDERDAAVLEAVRANSNPFAVLWQEKQWSWRVVSDSLHRLLAKDLIRLGPDEGYRVTDKAAIPQVE